MILYRRVWHRIQHDTRASQAAATVANRTIRVVPIATAQLTRNTTTSIYTGVTTTTNMRVTAPCISICTLAYPKTALSFQRQSAVVRCQL